MITISLHSFQLKVNALNPLQSHRVPTMEEAIPFSTLLKTLCTSHHQQNNNPKSQRTAAVASALVEVIQEKLGANSYDEVTPAAMFASALNAVTASVMTTKSSSSSDKNESMDQSPQASLLDILSQIVPYVSSSNPNLYIHQFSALSRALRGIVSSIPSPMHLSNNNNDATTSISAGWNALLRQCIRTSAIILNGILILENTKHLEKEILKCFHSTIVQHFDDPRAKVRRQAHSSAIELLSLSRIMMMQEEDGNDGSSEVKKGKGMLNDDLITDQLVEYSHHILLVSNYTSTTGKKKKKKMDQNNNNKNELNREKIVRLLHLLSFLESALPILSMKNRLSLAQDVSSLYEAITNNQIETTTTTATKGQHDAAMVANGALTVLLQIFDSSNHEQMMHHGEVERMKDVVLVKEEDSFCAKALSMLLESNASFIVMTKDLDDSRGGECRIVYTRCIVAIILRLFESSISSNNGSNENGNTAILSALTRKLLPLSLKSLLNTMGDESISGESAQSICAESVRIVRSQGFMDLVSQIDDSRDCIDQCIAITQNVLQSRFHAYWDCLLPFLGSFVVGIVQGMVPTTAEEGSNNEELITSMNPRLKPTVESLVELHTDVKEDKVSREAVERAIDTIVQGTGLEIFMGFIRLSKKKKNGGSVISNDRAWILSIVKKALTNHSSPYRPRLAFFQSSILSLARQCDAASAGPNNTVAETSIQRTHVIDLWSLFPSFCTNAADVEVSFTQLAQTISRAMSDARYPQLMVRFYEVNTICSVRDLF